MRHPSHPSIARALQPADSVTLLWNGHSVPLWRAYNARKFTDPRAGPVNDPSFMGFFADVTRCGVEGGKGSATDRPTSLSLFPTHSYVVADRPQVVQLTLPAHITAAEFGGVFFDNVVTAWTSATHDVFRLW